MTKYVLQGGTWVAKGNVGVSGVTLTVTVGDVTRPQGRANPPFTLSYRGFVNGEDESVLGGKPRFSTRANAKSDPGQYPVSVKGLTAANYAITYRPGPARHGQRHRLLTRP